MRTRVLLAVAALCLTLPTVAAQEASTPYNCFPTCSEVDGRFLSLAGAGLLTLGGDFINVQIISSGPGFELGLFDGDTIGGGPASGGVGHWDRVGLGELGVTQLNYQLFADPDGDGTGTTEIGAPGGWLSNVVNPDSGTFFTSTVNGTPSGVMPDNDWFDINVTNSPAAAANPGSQCPAGHFCYRLRVTLVPDLPMMLVGPRGSTESSFKLRSTGEISLRPLAFSFVGALRSFNDAAIIYPRFPDLSETTYDGTWRFVMRLDDPAPFFTVWGGDFDYGSWDCMDNDTNDPDTCMNTDPDSTCVPNSNPAPGFFGQIVPPWADGTFARTEGVAIGNNQACGQTTGAPNDDENPAMLVPIVPPCATDGMGDPIHCFFTRFPSVVYRLDTPVGSFDNDNPSGNQEWEQFRLETDPMAPADFYVNSLPAGEYVINYSGLDMANLNALRMSATVVGVPSASIGDRVWLDLNGNSVQDPGEDGINGVEVRLYRDSNGDGILDPGVDQLIATQTTSGDGDYDFLGVGAANYFVDVVESTLPPDLTLTTGNEPYLPGGPYPLAESEDHDDADFGYIGPCAPCEGKVTRLRLQYLGFDPALVEVFGRRGSDKNRVLFSGLVMPNEVFEFEGPYDGRPGFFGTVGTEITLAVNGRENTTIHTSCSQPIGPGLVSGDFQVVEAFSRHGGLICPLDGGGPPPPPPPPDQCNECSGKVTNLTLQYLGLEPVLVEVFQKKPNELVFSGLLAPGQSFTVIGTDKKGTLGTEIRIFVDGSFHTAIHTSCSQPIGPGLQSGDFLVIQGFSRNGGELCALP